MIIRTHCDWLLHLVLVRPLGMTFKNAVRIHWLYFCLHAGASLSFTVTHGLKYTHTHTQLVREDSFNEEGVVEREMCFSLIHFPLPNIL